MRLTLLPLLALAACGQQNTSGTSRNVSMESLAVTPATSDAQRRVANLPPGQRDGVLFRAIIDGNAPCQGVVETRRQPDVNGAPVYYARCSDGPRYGIAIDANGIAQVTRLDRGS